MPWLRRVEIILTSKDDPSNKTIFSNHRIDFEIRDTVGWPAATANITIFNLSLDEVKSLRGKESTGIYLRLIAVTWRIKALFQVVVLHNTPTLEVPQKEVRIGILSETYPTFVLWFVSNAVGFRRPPEHVTQLFCISKAYGASTDFKQMRSIPKRNNACGCN